MTSLLDSFLEKIGDRSAVVGVIGQGYVGLPLSLAAPKYRVVKA